MKRFLILLFVFILALSFIGCKGKAKLANKPVITFEFEEMVFNPDDASAQPVFKDFVKVDFKLYVKDADKAVKMFLAAVKSGYFNSKEEGTLNQRVKYSLNEPDHVYMIKFKFNLEKHMVDGSAAWIKDITKITEPWGEAFTPASNINIKKGTLCLNSGNKGHVIIFKSKLAEKGKFVPIGRVTPESMEALNKLFEVETTIGQTERTQQGQVVTSNPVTRLIFIKKVTISE
jgi:hypothetical protein